MTEGSATTPAWLRVAAWLLVLWALLGCVSLYVQLMVGPSIDPGGTAYDRQLHASLPLWFKMDYAVAVLSGLGGAVALILRRRIAVPLSALSVAVVAVQFGWMFLATDIIAVKGAWVTYFPAAILAVQSFQL